MEQVTPGTVFEICLVIEVFLIFYGQIGFDLFNVCKRKCSKNNESVFEPIAYNIPYLDALGEQNLLYILHEERYLFQKYGVERMSNDE